MSSKASRSGTAGFFRRHFPTLRGLGSRLGWPILLKQLRTDLRRARFYLSHFIALSVLGGGIILVIQVKVADAAITPPQVGRSLFDLFCAIQGLVVLVLFPAFSASAFTEERSSLSLDLLLITSLKPAEIVCGKFLAATAFCLLYILSSLPILSISFLFGGVTVSEVLGAYALLIAATLLISMFGIYVSSCSRSNLQASLTCYGVILLAGLYFIYLHPASMQAQAHFSSDRIVAGILAEILDGGEAPVLRAGLRALDALFVFSALFLLAANRIRPPGDNRSTTLRSLLLVYAPLRVLLGGIADFPDWLSRGAAGPRDLTAVAGNIRLAAIFLITAVVVFPTEDARVSPRLVKRFRKRAARMPLALLVAPGPLTGFFFALFLGMLVAGAGLLLHAFLAGSVGPAIARLAQQSLLTLPVYAAAIAALGFFLAASGFTPLYSRLTVVFVLVIGFLLPVIFSLGQHTAAPFQLLYCLSPWVLWDSLAQPLERLVTDEMRYELWGLPIIHAAKALHGTLAALFLALGLRGLAKTRRRAKSEARLPIPAPSA